MRRAAIVTCVLLWGPSPIEAQTAVIAASGGISAGDGGAAGAIIASGGYLTDKRIGFELEFSFAPGLDFPGPDVIIQTAVPSIFPIITYDISGRLLSLQANLLYELPASGRLRVIAAAGGGAANVEQRIRIRRPEAILPLPGDIQINPSGFPDISLPLVIPAIDIDRRVSQTGLSLNAGGTIEYAWTERLGVGLDGRYVHVFLDDGGLDLARIGGRVSWRF